VSTRIVNLSNNTLPLVHQTLFYPQADVVVDDSHERVIGEKSDEGDLLLAEGFIPNGSSRSSYMVIREGSNEGDIYIGVVKVK